MLLTFGEEFLHVETETPLKNPSGILSHQLLYLMGSWTYFDCGIPSLRSGSKVLCPSKMFMTKIRKLLKEYFSNFPGSVQFYLLLVSLRFWYKTDMEVIPSKIKVNIVNEL